MINLLIPEQDLSRQIRSQHQQHLAEMEKLMQEKNEESRWITELRGEHREFQVIIYYLVCRYV